MDDLAKGGAVGPGGAESGAGIFGGHGRCGPGADPVVGGCCSSDGDWIEAAEGEQGEQERGPSGVDGHGRLFRDW